MARNFRMKPSPCLSAAIQTCALVGLATLAQTLFAGQFNPTRSIGDQVTGWSKLPGTDGKEHSLEDLKSTDVVVVVFTCNSCPYAVDYETASTPWPNVS